MFQEIKWAYQRVVRGWDDTALWQLDSHFVDILIPPLKEFCINRLDTDIEHIKLNEERFKIYSKTLDLIEEYEKSQIWTEDGWSFGNEDKALKALAMYFAENIGWYWD